MTAHAMPDAGASRVLRWTLLALCVVIVIHGSLYPWLFEAPSSWDTALRAMFVDRLWWTGPEDALINVLLFLPIGAFGGLALEGWGRSPVTRVTAALSVAFVFALVLQLLQLWLPARTAAVSDALWNVVGTAVGMPLMGPLRPQVDRLAQMHLLRHRAALVMGLIWVATLAWPLMPSHNLRHVGQAVVPLWRLPPWSLSTVVDTALSLAAVLVLTRGMHRWRWFIASLLAGVVVGRLLGRDLQLTPSLLLGMLIGAVVGSMAMRGAARSGTLAIGAAALAWYAGSALHPFDWGASPAAFHWIPLWASLQAARVAHTLALMWALFWTGVWMALAQSLPWSTARTATVLTAYMMTIEVAQRWLPAQQADITPVLFPMLWWWFWRRWPLPNL